MTSHGHYPVNPGLGELISDGKWSDGVPPLEVITGLVTQTGNNFVIGTSQPASNTTPAQTEGVDNFYLGSFGQFFFNARLGAGGLDQVPSIGTGDLRVVIPEIGLDAAFPWNATQQRYQGTTGLDLWAVLGALLGQPITVQLYDPAASPPLDPADALWQPTALGGFWSGVLGTVGVQFKVEIALGAVDGQGGFNYDAADALYDTATYSTDDLYWVDLTGRVVDVAGGRGRQRLQDGFRPGQGTITLDNQDGVFNPQVGRNIIGDQAMRPGRWVRLSGKLTSSPNDQWTPLWVMRVQSLADEYVDAAHRILSKWNLAGIEAVLQQRSYTAQSPGGTQGWTFDEMLRDYWVNVLDSVEELLVTPDSYFHPLIADDYAGGSFQKIQSWAQAEGGDFYVGKEGLVYARGRDWLDFTAEPVLQIGAYDSTDVVVLGAQTAWDMTRIVNDARLTGEPWEFDNTDPENPVLIDRPTQARNNTQSQALYGINSFTQDGVRCLEDADVDFLAERLVTRFAFDTLRIDSLEVWAPTLEGVQPLLDLELGDVIQVQIVTAAGWTYAIRCFVNSVRHTVSHTDWKVNLGLDNVFRLDPRLGGSYSTAYSDAYKRVEG